MRIEYQISERPAVLTEAGLTVNGVSYSPNDAPPPPAPRPGDDPDVEDIFRQISAQETMRVDALNAIREIREASMEPHAAVRERIGDWYDSHNVHSPGDGEPPEVVSCRRIVDPAAWAPSAPLKMWAIGHDLADVCEVLARPGRSASPRSHQEGMWHVCVATQDGARVPVADAESRAQAETLAEAAAVLMSVPWRIAWDA